MATKATTTELTIDPLKQGCLTLRMIGTTPLFFNSMSLKAKRTLLLGGGKKTAAEKRELKHDPEQEFRDSIYRMRDGETLLGFPAPGVKAAMATAALETKSVTKASVNRLIFLPEQRIRVWGKPYLRMDVVRSADMNRTPDIRTRAYLPQWCAQVDIAFTMPALSQYSIVSLLQNAGTIVGIGDFRQEKGRGGHGTFRVSAEGQEDAEWDAITRFGRAEQVGAMDQPEFADEDTADLMAFLEEERERRAA